MRVGLVGLVAPKRPDDDADTPPTGVDVEARETRELTVTRRPDILFDSVFSLFQLRNVFKYSVNELPMSLDLLSVCYVNS